MGAYLSEPRTEKASEDHQSETLSVGASSMQGWRVSQEDAHNAILEYDVQSSLFAVYDGHGGHEVAEYTAKKLPDFIRSQQTYKDGNIEKALIESFVGFDETIIHRDVVAELKVLAGTQPDGDEDEHDPNEVDHLYKEATMPIEEVISQYGDCVVRKPLKNPALAKVGESSGKKPISPFLKAKKTGVTNSGDGGEANSHIRFDEAEEDMEEDDKKNVAKAEEVPEEKSDDEGAKVKTEVAAGEAATKEVNGSGGATKENGSSAATKSGEEDKKNLVNGHVNGESDAHPKDDNGVAKSNGDSSPSSKGKGKGKGKGKSNVIVAKKQSSEQEVEEAEEAPQEAPEKKSPARRSAQQLYHMLQDDEEVYDEESEDDDESFEHAEASSDDDDDEEEETQEEEEEEEEEESDSDEEEEEQGEEFIGGDFNEEPGNDSGCTAVVALLRGRELFVANAGDSRCVVCRDGKAVEMSFDHKPEDAPEMERIKKAGGKVTPDGRVNGGLNLSRAIGDHAYKTNKSLPLTEQMISPVPDVKQLTIDPATDRFMILACDGIWNSMSSQEVIDFVGQKLDKNPEKMSSICEELFEHCLSPDTLGDGTGCDNMTAVIVKFKGGELKSAESNPSLKRSAEDAAAVETPSKKACTE